MATDYLKAKKQMQKRIVQILSKKGATEIKLTKTESTLDIGYEFVLDGVLHHLKGIKHFYGLEDDEDISELWNWHLNDDRWRDDEKMLEEITDVVRTD